MTVLNFSKIRKGALSLLALAIALLTLLPILWIAATSLREPSISMKLPPSFLPKPPFIWENYAQVFKSLPFFLYFRNSFVVAVVATSVQLIFSAMAAFALTRIPWKGKTPVFLVILAAMMVPAQVTIIPLFIVMSKLHLINTLYSLILPATVYPLAVFLLKQFMATIPASYDEAAHIDGAGRGTVFWKIILPMVKPSLTVAGMMHFLFVWNDFFRPLIFINSQTKMTMPLGLHVLQGFMGAGSISIVLAGVLLSIIPPFLIFMVGQKYLMEGMASGGIKG
ncbi:MAG: carbohydrate ABC transporter permease [Spirochaetales bacterium]|nr:carbohydrate ABC transporter permease [Spirochaetales bacterium]